MAGTSWAAYGLWFPGSGFVGKLVSGLRLHSHKNSALVFGGGNGAKKGNKGHSRSGKEDRGGDSDESVSGSG